MKNVGRALKKGASSSPLRGKREGENEWKRGRKKLRKRGRVTAKKREGLGRGKGREGSG